MLGFEETFTLEANAKHAIWMNPIMCKIAYKFRLQVVLTAILGIVALNMGALSVDAQQIDLSLNLIYENPNNADEGGSWEVVAKSDEFGINLLNFQLSGIDSTGILSNLPTGSVNGAAGVNAGFQGFAAVSSGETVTFSLGQFHVDPDPAGSSEVGAFYGVGTTSNGSPDFAGADPGATTVGPALSTLTGVNNTPWATGDTLGEFAWDSAAIIATGTFAAGSIPEFVDLDGSLTFGTVYTSIGTSTTVGTSSSFETTAITGIVRDNLLPLPDYNNDGVVDLADYTVWRSSLGATVATPGEGADGNFDGIIDTADYLAWQANFGATVPAAAVSIPVAIPEPSSVLLALLSVLAFGVVRREKQAVFAMQGVFCKKRDYRQKLLDTQETPSHNATS